MYFEKKRKEIVQKLVKFGARWGSVERQGGDIIRFYSQASSAICHVHTRTFDVNKETHIVVHRNGDILHFSNSTVVTFDELLGIDALIDMLDQEEQVHHEQYIAKLQEVNDASNE